MTRQPKSGFSLFLTVVISMLYSSLTLGCNPFETVVHHFFNIAKIYRPPGQESKIREFIHTFATQNGFYTYMDKVGNLYVDLKGTGAFEHLNTKSRTRKTFPDTPKIGIQVHLDMVHEPNDPSLFKNGITLERTGKWIKTKDEVTNNGADNGIGVASALRLLSNPPNNMPPIRLIFTIQEETDMKGARNIPPKALKSLQAVFNLDSIKYGVLCCGAMGDQIYTISHSKFAGRTLSKKVYQTITLKISGLKGGHSGLESASNRANGIKVLLSTFSRLVTSFGTSDIWFINASSSAPQKIGTIPNTFELTFAVPKKISIDQTTAKNVLTQHIAQTYRGETRTDITVKFSIEPALKKKLTGQSWQEAVKIFEHLDEQIPMYIVENNKAYPNSVQTTVNMSYFKMSPVTGMTLMVMTRSFEAQSITKYRNTLDRSFNAQNNFSIKTSEVLPPWKPSDTPWLLPLISKLSDINYTSELVTAGLETAMLKQIAPHLELVSMGPNLKDIHSPQERIDLTSLEKFTYDLERILIAVGAHLHGAKDRIVEDSKGRR